MNSDDLLNIARAGNATFVAGMRAAEDNSESARRLRRLCLVVEETLTQMSEELSPAVCSRLIDGLFEARKP